MERIKESYPVNGSLRVDRERHLIRDVRLAGFESGNGRRYTREAYRGAVSLYEGARVNLDHARDGDTRVSRRFGRVVNARLADDGMRGDVRYNPRHPDAEMVLWFAENDPQALGLSHDVYVSKRTDPDGTVVVESIRRVCSVDIVADPATTGGLFEELDLDELDPPPPANGGEAPMDSAEHLGRFILAIIKDPGLDMAAKRKKILAALKLMDGPAPDDPPSGDAGPEFTDEDADAAMESLRRVRHRAARWAARRLDADRVREASLRRREELRERCLARLPDEAVTPVFLDSLLASPYDSVSRLIEDRRALVGGGRSPRTSVATPPARPSVKELVQRMWEGN